MAIWATTLSPFFAPQQQTAQVRRYMPGAPEIYLTKAIDNSRLVRVADKAKRREMIMFSAVMGFVLMLGLGYVVQHLASIQCGYDIEDARTAQVKLLEQNRILRLEEASLKDPSRIDAIARSMGMQMPVAGQVQHLDVSGDLGAPVMARAAGVSVVSLSQ